MSKKSETTELAVLPEIPYAKYVRNEAGLLTNVNYKFNEDGSVNWKGMLNPKHIVLNKQLKTAIEEKYNRSFDEIQLAIQEGQTDSEDIEDRHKLILLAGIKELAKLRGYSSVDYSNNVSGPEYTAVKCTIAWIANYETKGLTTYFSSLADAHQGNCNSFAINFLNAIAENRAFVRCVRNFLNIHVVGYDEIGGSTPAEENTVTSNISPVGPKGVLIKKFGELKEFKVTWITFQKYLMDKTNIEGAAEWNSIDDVPNDRAYEVTGYVSDQIKKLTEKLNKK